MKPQICLVPKLGGLGGMVSFQSRLAQGLQEKGIRHTFDLNDPNNTAILVIGGTRHIWQLWRAKSRNVKIVQRLNGLNWLHKIEKTPFSAALKAEINNQILALIRRYLANQIVYQSQFSHVWWRREFGNIQVPNTIIYNGVDLDKFTPNGPEKPPEDHYRLLLVEGRLTGANSRGLFTAVRLGNELRKILEQPLEMMVVGEVNDELMARAYRLAPELWITWRGIVSPDLIPGIDRSAHVLFSADLNAACPNSVIEAMASGLPIVAYDTGALQELVQDGAGEVVPYGANHWQLEPPEITPLAKACAVILENNSSYRLLARKRAEKAFGLGIMIDSYLDVLVN